MSRTSLEIASQPALWARAVELGQTATVIPRGARTAFIGCGSSYYTALAAAGLRECLGEGESDAFVASEAPLTRGYDVVVAISRSGESTEVVRALSATHPSTSTIAITAVGGMPLGQIAGTEIVLDFADETSVVQSRFPTTVLAHLRASFGDDLTSALRDVHRALEEPLPSGLSGYAQQVFLGSGWHLGLALEAALKVREAAQAWSEAYPTGEYRHGPITIATDATLVWLFGDSGNCIVKDAHRAGARVITSDLDPLAQLVVAQRAAVALAESKGLDPDNPRALARAVVLPTL